MEIISDKPKCHCGIFGIFGTDDAAINTYYGLHALQHRGPGSKRDCNQRF